jgi:hypothetical protein
MPHTTYGVLKAIRSHQVSSPKVADELATGRPNACNLCHLDKTLAWSAEHLDLWYGQTLPTASKPWETSVADAVRLALSGDAGQRALLAWHFGWEPAANVSKTGWGTIVLARLLDDPYAAVRCIAERSLRKLGADIPGDYDFTTAPGERAAVAPRLVQEWTTVLGVKPGEPIPSETLVFPGNPEATHANFERLLESRDDHPVRLRE